MQGALQLAMLEEVRTPEPPIRLSAMFFEPGSAEQVAAELDSLGDVVLALGAPLGTSRECDAMLLARGVPAAPPMPRRCGCPGCSPGSWPSRRMTPSMRDSWREGAYHEAALFETNPDGVFCALQGHRLPAKRHPLGLQLRIAELDDDHVIDEGGDLWHRRIEEIDAIGCALCAHRYALGHASWIGDPDEAVIVLPGSSLPAEFPREGVLPPVERLHLPAASA